MKKVLIAAVAATSMLGAFGVAHADGTDALETQLFRDRGANIVTPENPGAAAPSMAQSTRLRAINFRAQVPMDGGYGDSLER